MLEAASKDSYVWYVRCNACGHVWTVSKDGSETSQDVTPRDRSDRKPA